MRLLQLNRTHLDLNTQRNFCSHILSSKQLDHKYNMNSNEAVNSEKSAAFKNLQLIHYNCCVLAADSTKRGEITQFPSRRRLASLGGLGPEKAL